MDRDVAVASIQSCQKLTEFPCFRIFQAVHFLSNYFVGRYAHLIVNVFLGKSAKQAKQYKQMSLTLTCLVKSPFVGLVLKTGYRIQSSH